MTLLTILKITTCDVRLASKGTMILPSFVKIGQMINKLKLGGNREHSGLISLFLRKKNRRRIEVIKVLEMR
jgi:hypothetical protein